MTFAPIPSPLHRRDRRRDTDAPGKRVSVSRLFSGQSAPGRASLAALGGKLSHTSRTVNLSLKGRLTYTSRHAPDPDRLCPLFHRQTRPPSFISENHTTGRIARLVTYSSVCRAARGA